MLRCAHYCFVSCKLVLAFININIPVTQDPKQDEGEGPPQAQRAYLVSWCTILSLFPQEVSEGSVCSMESWPQSALRGLY